MAITRIELRQLKLPLVVPYKLSYRTFEAFEPYLVEIQTNDGRYGFGDGHISPGSSGETREGGWAYCQEMIDRILGLEPEEAIGEVQARASESKVAASVLLTALEVLMDSSLLTIPEETVLPLLVPINATEEGAIADEVETLIGQGFRTFKVKVGKDVDADLARVAGIQRACAGRATLRLDANRAYDRNQGQRFAASLDPTGIELFEQPCDADDWEANAAVAAVSTVPLMLDEPICSLADIERAGGIDGVALCKLKLKRFGSLAGLKAGLDAVRANGMEPVLGDGLGSEITSWFEACVARTTIRNAGEFNGFLKPVERLLSPSIPFSNGCITLPAGYRPALDRKKLDAATRERANWEL